MGGTGIDRGMGGTGVLAQDRGMGGTGIGVIGTVTGFGSICVNGVRIAYDADTPVSENGVAVGASMLAQGHTVAVSALESNGQLAATSISLAHTLTGPLTSAPNSTGAFSVMGVQVESAFAVGVDTTSLGVGDTVTIDGLQRADGTIDATRIVKTSKDANAVVRGALDVSSGAVRIGTVPVTLSANQHQDLNARNGQWAVAEGGWADGRLAADVVSIGPEFDPVATSRLSVEGYLIDGGEGDYTVRGVPIRDDANRRLNQTTMERLASGQRVHVVGRVEANGTLRIQTIVVPDYLNPLQNSAAADSPDTSEEVSESRSAVEVREQLQEERGTYSTVVTRPNVLTDSPLSIRTDSLRSRPTQIPRPGTSRPPERPPPRPPPRR